MSQETSPSSGRAYGLARVARIWGVPRAGGQRLRRTVHPHAQGEPALGAGLQYVDLPAESGGMGSEYHAATRMVISSMLARASAGVREPRAECRRCRL